MSRSWSPLGRAIHRATQPARRAVLRRRHLGQLTTTEVEGIPLIVLPRVFHPGVFRTSGVLVRALRAHGSIGLGTRVLDLGTGTGVLGVAAAALGGAVTAVDINPDAVRCTRMNAILNRVDDRMTVFEADLFEGVGTGFDLVLFNPPFFDGVPRDHLDGAWRSVDARDRFVAGLAGVLAQGGRALLVFSNHGDQDGLLAAFRSRELVARTLVAVDLGDELVSVFDIRPAGGES
jgi:release factor glutamine methyltransferase